MVQTDWLPSSLSSISLSTIYYLSTHPPTLTGSLTLLSECELLLAGSCGCPVPVRTPLGSKGLSLTEVPLLQDHQVDSKTGEEIL